MRFTLWNEKYALKSFNVMLSVGAMIRCLSVIWAAAGLVVIVYIY
jgi:hypothetical protein